MSKFAIIRLGKDSVSDIKNIDALHDSPSAPLSFTVNCTQVPPDLEPGDYIFVCLGSDNNNGTATPWKRGLRAFGKVTAKSGGPGYNDPWAVSVEIRVVLPQSVAKKDFLARAPAAYFWFCDIPVLGVDTYSNQTVQMVKPEPNQNVQALFYALNSIFPEFRRGIRSGYPELDPYFDYQPEAPTEDRGGDSAGLMLADSASGSQLPTEIDSQTLENLVQAFVNDAQDSALRVTYEEAHRFFASLLSKRFLIATGLAGSGKTKLSQAVAQWMTPKSLAFDPFFEGAVIEGVSAQYLVTASDQISVEFFNQAREDGKKVILPRALIKEWADEIDQNGMHNASARVVRESVKLTSVFSDQLNSFETHLKAAALALLGSRQLSVGAKCFEIVPVGADWTGNENILGYANGLDESNYITKPALDLILRATLAPSLPHFLILDEMNLSHVERYFSDVLSVMESDEPIHLHRDASRTANGDVVPNSVALPKNLFIIGTVNVDETTYMFSPKVLDRANVIEFRMSSGDLEAYLNNPLKPDLTGLSAQGAQFGKIFVHSAKSAAPVLVEGVKERYDAEMLLFFYCMSGNGTEFGYRVAYEAGRFVHFFDLLRDRVINDPDWFDKAFDLLIFQKFLPKLHGSRAKLGPLLKKLWFLCTTDFSQRGEDPVARLEVASRSVEKTAEPAFQIPLDAPYPVSAEKLARMWRLLHDNGFASFAEA